MTPNIPKLLLITDLDVYPDLERGVTAALEGGVKHILLRIKNSTTANIGNGNKPNQLLLAWAKKLFPLTKAHQATLLISGDLQVAMAFTGVGLHLPETAIPTSQARQLLGQNRLLGRSCHDLQGGVTAFAQGANYVTLSPIFATKSHPNAQPLGAEKFARIRNNIPGPVLALGGIDIDNIPKAMLNGADGVALIRSIFASPDIKKAAKNCLRAVDNCR